MIRLVDGALRTAAGPHTQGREVVGGYLTVLADDMDQAEKLFGTHPHLRFGSIEVGERGCED